MSCVSRRRGNAYAPLDTQEPFATLVMQKATGAKTAMSYVAAPGMEFAHETLAVVPATVAVR